MILGQYLSYCHRCIGYISNSLVVILLLLLFDPSYVDTPTPKACLIVGVGVTTMQ